LAVADPPRAAAATEESEYPFGSSVALFSRDVVNHSVRVLSAGLAVMSA